jgi:hypothetical protein
MFALRIVAQATVSVPVRARAQSRQARQDSAIRSPFPPFVISVIFAVTPTRAIPFAPLRETLFRQPMLVWARAQRHQARQDPAIRSPFPPFVYFEYFVVPPTRAIPENHSSHWYRRSPILHFQFSIHQ